MTATSRVAALETEHTTHRGPVRLEAQPGNCTPGPRKTAAASSHPCIELGKKSWLTQSVAK